MTGKAISTLKSAINTALPDNTARLIDPVDVRQTGLIDTIDTLNPARPLASAIAPTDTVITDAALADKVHLGRFVTVGAYTVQAEMRRVVGIAGAVVTVDLPFNSSHFVDDQVVVNSGRRDITLWGAAPGLDVSVAVNAAVADFAAETDPIGGMIISTNNLFFPPGDHLVGNTMLMPIIATGSNTSQTLVFGDNANLFTNSFLGPFFDSADGINPTHKYTFSNLNFREQISDFPIAGTAHVFTWRFYRQRVLHCNFTRFQAIMKEIEDGTGVHFQRLIWIGNLFNLCREVLIGTNIFGLSWVGNYVLNCNHAINFPATNRTTAANIEITGNSEFEGCVDTPIVINGGIGVTISGCRFERNGGFDGPDIDMVNGVAPRGITIESNSFQPDSGIEDQQNNPNWRAVKISPAADSVVVKGNVVTLSSTQVIDPNTQNKNGACWEIGPNHSTRTVPVNSLVERLNFGSRTVERKGRVEITGIGTFSVNFGEGAAAWYVGDGTRNKSFTLSLVVTAHNNSIFARLSTWRFKVILRHDDANGLAVLGTPVKEVDNNDGASWDANVVAISLSGAAVFSGITITSTAHGLVDGQRVHLTTTDTLPSPGVEDFTYEVTNATANDFGLLRFDEILGLQPISWSGGVGTHEWHRDEIDVQIDGIAANTFFTNADLTLKIDKNV